MGHWATFRVLAFDDPSGADAFFMCDWRRALDVTEGAPLHVKSLGPRGLERLVASVMGRAELEPPTPEPDEHAYLVVAIDPAFVAYLAGSTRAGIEWVTERAAGDLQRSHVAALVALCREAVRDQKRVHAFFPPELLSL